jgi:1-acyl-sn-glycerol-3-phosphate acyltransferase
MKAVSGYLRFVLAVVNSMFFAALELIVIAIRKNDRVFHALARGWAHSTLWMCGVKVKVHGLELVDPTRHYVYVSNHASMFDIPAILASIPDQIRILYKKELNWVPVFGWGLKYGKTYIGIDRGRGQEAVQSLEAAAAKIRDGASVILFGEGTRTPDGRIQPFKRGPFSLAARANVPVVPVTINGSYDILPRGSWRIRPGRITLVLSPPIPPQAAGKEGELALRDLTSAAIANNLGRDR